MKIAVCFLSRGENNFNYIELKKQAENSKNHEIDIYYYINKNNYNYQLKNNYIYFNYNYLQDKFNYQYIFYKDKYKRKNKYTSYIGLTFLVWLDMYSNHKNEYDMYMFYEDDLSYFGNKNLFDSIDFNYDILFQSKCINIKDDKLWYWYNIYDYNILASYTIYHILMNIYVANSIFIEGLLKFMEINYMHHEGLIPTYALNQNYKINYINNYISLYASYIDNIKNIKIYSYDLIHPVKKEEMYNRIKFKRNKKHDIRKTVE